MSLEIPTLNGMPTVKIFNSQQEIEAETHIKLCHGFYDPSKNLILATADSVAHEIGHFRDIRSGKFKELCANQSRNDVIEAKMRNELVAILFSYSKCGIGGTTLEHEYKLMSWLLFQHQKNHLGDFNQKPIQEWTLTEIQDASDWLVKHEHPWRERLEFLFKGYLIDQHISLTYSADSRLTKLSSKVL